MNRVIIKQGYRGALYEDGVFLEVLSPGAYDLAVSFFSRKVREIKQVDVRNRSLIIKGQEILTADKVAVRVSILVSYRVTDVAAALHEVESYPDRIYEDVQLSTRRFLAVKTLDEILKLRNEISDAVREDVHEAASRYGVEVFRADVKDLVFPGNLRDIMNRVLETERRSEAMLIEAETKADAILIQARAEKEAQETRLQADRALAQQLIECPELLRLKELEAFAKIAAQPGNSFYIGLGDGFARSHAQNPSKADAQPVRFG